MNDDEKRIFKDIQLSLEANFKKLTELEQKESRNYDNINELRIQISINDDQIEKLEKDAGSARQTEVPKYLWLKLDKKVDPIQLDVDIYNFGRKNVNMEDNSKNNITWRDYAEILLKADGSWDKKPYLYNKYPKGVASHTDFDLGKFNDLAFKLAIPKKEPPEPIMICPICLTQTRPIDFDKHILVEKAEFGWLWRHAGNDDDIETLEEYTKKMIELEKYLENEK